MAKSWFNLVLLTNISDWEAQSITLSTLVNISQTVDPLIALKTAVKPDIDADTIVHPLSTKDATIKLTANVQGRV